MNAYIAGTDSLYVRLFLYREAGMCYEIKTEDHTRFPDDHISSNAAAGGYFIRAVHRKKLMQQCVQGQR